MLVVRLVLLLALSIPLATTASAGEPSPEQRFFESPYTVCDAHFVSKTFAEPFALGNLQELLPQRPDLPGRLGVDAQTPASLDIEVVALGIPIRPHQHEQVDQS